VFSGTQTEPQNEVGGGGRGSQSAATPFGFSWKPNR
jgi:hypothetical protein